MEQAIKIAIENGWKPIVDTVEAVEFGEVKYNSVWAYEKDGTGACFSQEHIVLNPQFWQALGKGLEWKHNNAKWVGDWLYYWHRFIDHLAEGKSIDDFFSPLTKEIRI